jgi:hypothetical protein
MLVYEGYNVILKLPNGLISFRLIMVASYFRSDIRIFRIFSSIHLLLKAIFRILHIVYRSDPGSKVTKPRKRGRPKGSRNKKSTIYTFAKESFDHELAIKL